MHSFQLQSALSTIHLCDKKKMESSLNIPVTHGPQEVKKIMLIKSKCEKNMKKHLVLIPSFICGKLTAQEILGFIR